MKATRPSDCVLVLGMHRSGTSAVAGSLKLGAIALGSNLLAPGEDNPKGYFEHAEAVRINDALLDALDRRWDDMRSLPEGWERSAPAARAREDIREWIAREFDGAPLFAIKDPRMCRVLPVWLDALDALSIRARVLLVARHPAEVSASIEKRNGWPAVVSERLWLEYMLEAELGSRGRDRAVVTYDRFLKAPAKELSVGLEKVGLGSVAQAMLATDLSAFVSRHDRHHHESRDSAPETMVGHLASEIYGLFVAGTDGSPLHAEAFDLMRSRVREAVAPVSVHVDGLSRMVLAARRANEDLQADLVRTRSELNAQLEWSERTVRTQEELHAELAEMRSGFLAQQEWSRRAVEEREKLQAELAGVRSDLLAQQEWSRRAVEEREKLQAELAGVRSDLLAQQEWSRRAVEEREKLQAELAGVRSDLLAQQEWSRRAVEEREKLQAELADVRSNLLAQEEWSRHAVTEREKLQAELADASARLQEQITQSERMAEKSEALRAQLHASSLHADQLQFRLNRYESTWLGRLHRWHVERTTGAQDTNEKDE